MLSRSIQNSRQGFKWPFCSSRATKTRFGIGLRCSACTGVQYGRHALHTTATDASNRRDETPRRESRVSPVVLFAGFVVGFGVWNIQQSKTITSNDAPPPLPPSPPPPSLSQPIKQAEHSLQSEDPINWKGMALPALDLSTANAKLRAEETSMRFESGSETAPSRFDSTRLQSNSPSEDERSFATANVGDVEDWKFWGVYDGHAGWATSHVLQQSLATYVVNSLRQARQTSLVLSPEAIDHAIKAGFVTLDDEIVNDGLRALSDAKTHAEAVSRIAPARAGSCALLAVFDPTASVLRVACTGDSRAVLGQLQPSSSSSSSSYTAIPLSVDQTGFNPAELSRIQAEHPDHPEAVDTKTGRVLGLAVTRAFGDHRWKWPLGAITKCHEDFYGSPPRPTYVSPPYVTASPEVTTTRVSAGDFLILASDGLWDHISSEHAVECVRLWIDHHKNPNSSVVTTSTSSGNKDEDERSEIITPTVPLLQPFGWETKATPAHFVVEDDNAATHLVRNVLGGTRREVFLSALTTRAPDSRNVRDDITVQVVFFGKMGN